MYCHLVYYSGDRSLIESMVNKGFPGIVGDRVFFLNAVDYDGDALRFYLNDGSPFDAIFLLEACARSVYQEVLEAVRGDGKIIDLDIRDRQIRDLPKAE